MVMVLVLVHLAVLRLRDVGDIVAGPWLSAIQSKEVELWLEC